MSFFGSDPILISNSRGENSYKKSLTLVKNENQKFGNWEYKSKDLYLDIFFPNIFQYRYVYLCDYLMYIPNKYSAPVVYACQNRHLFPINPVTICKKYTQLLKYNQQKKVHSKF